MLGLAFAQRDREVTPACARAHALASDVPRIMHVITHLDIGGAERVAMQLIGGLRDRFRFSLFAVIDDGARDPVGREMAAALAGWGVPLHCGTRGRFKSGGALVAARALARAMTDDGIWLIHLHTEIPELTWAIASVMSRKVRRTPVIRTIHNSELWIDWSGIGRCVTRRLHRADRVAVSHAAAAADGAIIGGGPETQADVVFNGVALPGTLKAAFGSPFRVLFAGRLVHQKGADLLPAILAAAAARAMRTDVEIVVAGHGPLAEGLAHDLAGLAIAWKVSLVPPIDGLAAQIAAYDCVLMPSRFEGFGLLALEALLAGVPVVATIARGLAEVLPVDYPLAAAVDDSIALGTLLAAVIDDGSGYVARIATMRDGIAARFSESAMLDGYARRYAVLAGPAAP
jgi:glycosyltransferase involved in cell wall biosynthesis